MIALSPFSANGTQYTWNGGGGNVNWSTAGNWTGGTPASATTTDLIFAGTTNVGTAGTPLNQNIATPFVLNSITFSSGGGAFYLGGNSLRFDGSGNTITQGSSSAISIANNIDTPQNKNPNTLLTLTGNGTGVVTLSGVISLGSGGRDYDINKTGTSTFCLSGANTYTGQTTISAGTLQIGANERLADSGALTVSGGTFDLQTFNETVGTVTLTSGSITGTGTSTLTGSSYLVQSGTVSAILGGTGSTLTKTTAGTVTLTGANTYTGATTISAGVLNIQNAAGLGTTAAGTTVSSGAALQLQNGIAVGAEALTLNGAGISSDGALRNISGNNSWGGNLTLGSASSICSDAGTLTLSGTITNGGFAVTFGGAGNITANGLISGTGSLIKNGNGTLTLGASNTFSGGSTLNGGTTIVFGGSLGASTGAATINAATLDVAATVSSTRNFTLGSASSTIMVDPNLTFTATGVLSGTGVLNKTGSGTLVLGGNNSFTGGTVVSAGTLQISASERLLDSGTLTVSGGTFDVQTFAETVNAITLSSGSIIGTTGTLTGTSFTLQSGTVSAILAGGGSVTKSTSGTVTLSGANTYTGGTSINGGILCLNSSGSLGSSGTISFGGGTLQYTSNNTTDYSNRFSSAINQAFSIDTNGQNATLATVIASSGGTFAKTGSGTLTLSGANTYTGATTVSGGTLQVNVNNALGTTAAGTTVSSGAALKLNGVNYSTAEGLTLNGTGVTNGGALVNSGTSTFAGAIAIATNATINAGGGTLNLTGGISKNGTTLTLAGGGTININNNGITGNAANSDLVVDGTTVVLNTANTYNGPTTIQNSGTLRLGASNVLPTSPQTDMTVNTSSIFDLASHNDGVASLAGDSTATVKNSTASSTGTLTVNPGTGVSTTFSGVIAGTNGGAQGDVALIKSGAGTLTLSGTNTFSGSTTVNGGTLIAAGASGSALGSSTAITVNSGGTLLLGASDQISNSATVTLHGGTLARGSGNYNEGGTGLVGMGALTLNASGSHIDLGTGTVGILTFASFSPGGNTLTIDNWTGTVNTQGITGSTDRLIFDSDQSGNLGSFNFTGFAPGATQFSLGSGYFELTPVAVPEPATYIPGILALAVLAGYQIRSRRNR